MAGQPGLFDRDERCGALSAARDPLQRLAAVIDFELFRPALDPALARSNRAQGGPPYEAVPMLERSLIVWRKGARQCCGNEGSRA